METEDIRYLPGKAQLPQQTTDAVVKIPFGAHPTSCYPIYTYDPHHIQQFMKVNFDEYKKQFIDVESHAKYLENTGGSQTILNILL